MKPIPSLIPRFNIDYSIKDFFIGLDAVFIGKKIDTSFFKNDFGSCICFTNYDRSGIYILLKSLGLPTDSKVGVPLYTCEVVLKAIVKAGLTPRFIDINQNYTIDICDLKKKIKDIDALIIIHTFGRPADMESIKKIAGNLPIIEDCAHSIYSKYHGKMTGTLANAGVLSLPKYLSVGGGGMIILNDKNLRDKVCSYLSESPKHSLLNEVKHLFECYLRSFFYHKPWFGLFALPIGLSLEGKIDLMNKKSFKVMPIYTSDLAIASQKVKDFESKIKIQRNNSFFLIEALKDMPLTLPLEPVDSYCNYYLFPILVNNKNTRDDLRDYMANKGVDTSTLFSNIPYIAKLKYGYEDDCPFTEYVCDRIITIPNHYVLKTKELSKVVESIKSYKMLKNQSFKNSEA